MTVEEGKPMTFNCSNSSTKENGYDLTNIYKNFQILTVSVIDFLFHFINENDADENHWSSTDFAPYVLEILSEYSIPAHGNDSIPS